MLRLPSLHMFRCQQKVRIFCRFCRTINHIDRCNDPLHVHCVCVAIFKVFAGNPMMGRIEMGSRMFPQFHPVPCKERSICIIFTDFVNFDFWGIFCEIFWQPEDRGTGTQRRCTIDNFYFARKEHLPERSKNTGGGH